MDEDLSEDVGAVRAFNRLYTSRFNLLASRLEGSAFTLSEARTLYEIAMRSDPNAAEIARALDLDRAQISRTLKRFADRGLIEGRDDPDNARRTLLSLTSKGRATFADLERKTETSVAAMLDRLPFVRRRRLLAAMMSIGRVLGTNMGPVVTLRGLRAGDLGLVAARQGLLYAEDYGWTLDFEALVARILSDFQGSFDAAKDAAWIADIDDAMVGSVFLVRGDAPETAKLRLLYVEPDARGAGVGKTLVSACIAKARALGYRRLDLWTDSSLLAAQSLYRQAGFSLVSQTPHHSFGQDLIGQTWSLAL